MIKHIVKKTLKDSGIDKNKKILVALSGGKDSSATAFLLKKLGYDVEGLYVDLCVGDYSKNCLKKIKELCNILEIKLYVYDLKKEQKISMKDIWKKTKKKGFGNCATCGIMKKWVLNKKAREIGVDYIATGHNLDDEAQTFLMNVLKGSLQLSSNTGVVTNNVSDKKFVTRVKPLFYVLEEDVLKFAKKKKLPFIEGKCPNAEDSYRIELREWMNKNINKKQKKNIVKNFDMVKKDIKGLSDLRKNYCSVCGELSRGDVCKKCSLSNSSKSLNTS